MSDQKPDSGGPGGAGILRAALARVPETIPDMAALAPQDRIIRAEEHADLIASGADILWASEKAAKNAAEDGVRKTGVADAITGGLAILACRPGGVTFGGLHWHHEDHEDCPGPGTLELEGLDRRESKGAYYTPRFLAEEITLGALEALVYRPGPLHTADSQAWRLISSAEILNLKVGDIAVGSGVFLVAAVRYLAGRLAEAWRSEAGEAAPPVWKHGVFPPLPDRGPMVMAARRLVIRCLYGTDIDPTAVELARLSLSLMAPMTPAPVHLNVQAGDSLLGLTSLEQLIKFHMDPSIDLPDLLDRPLVNGLAAWEAALRRMQA